ncbi:MAG: sigma-E processing peptidase SpoIIGA [Oscillospiraceae bacterium]|nr:sigma-E processing peptidase SpoIIGA [Oscillospiraceae bacterium]
MPLYLDVLILLNFLVDFLMLIATNRLSGHPNGVKKCAVGAVLGGLYGGACMVPGLGFLGNILWRLVSLGAIGGIAFGFRREAVRRCILFVFLSMALGGVALGLEGDFWSLILSAGAVCGMCLLGFRGRVGAEYVPVEVDGLRLTALRDTGNTLTDSITGQQILVVSAQFGQRLFGLPQKELADPVRAVEKGKGLRLIPFHAVGNSGGLLPAKRFENVVIGRWKGSCLVAVSPNELPYEALTGGVE